MLSLIARTPSRLRPAAFLHTSAPASSPTLLAGGLSVAAAALAARYALQAYEQQQGGGGAPPPDGAPSPSRAADKDEPPPGSSPTHKSFLAAALAKRFYRGDFEDKMTRREAALILGVRESAAPERVRERHRKLLMLNHPDMGGSTFLAGKVNEAKDFLLKGPSGGR